MKRLLAITICVLMLALCACQPTPEEEYVINKGDNIAEQKVEAGALPGGMDAQPVFPAHWDDDIKTEYKELAIEADIIVSEQDGCPVHRVARHAFTPEELALFAGEFFDGVTGIQEGNGRTREEFDDAMLNIADKELPEETKSMQLEQLESDRAQAASDDDFVRTTALTASDFEGKSYVHYMVRQADGRTGIMVISPNGRTLTMSKRGLSGIQPKDVIESDGGYEGEKDAVVEAEISLDEAVSAAGEFFSRIGAEGFSLADRIESRYFDSLPLEVISTGWNLHFTRSFGYEPINTTINDGDGTLDSSVDAEDAYSAKWKCEWIEVYVSGNGVEHFTWYDPVDDLGVVNENVELMDFNSLSKAIKRYFKARISNPKQSLGYYVIDKLVLTTIPQKIKDSDEAYMMPVWVCNIVRYESLADWTSVFRLPGGGREINRFTIVFNALDGARIDVPFD